MAKKSGTYLGLGLPLIVNLLLCFFLGWILTCVDRFLRGELILGIIAIFFGWIMWIIDFVSLIVNDNQIKWLAKL